MPVTTPRPLSYLSIGWKDATKEEVTPVVEEAQATNRSYVKWDRPMTVTPVERATADPCDKTS